MKDRCFSNRKKKRAAKWGNIKYKSCKETAIEYKTISSILIYIIAYNKARRSLTTYKTHSI